MNGPLIARVGIGFRFGIFGLYGAIVSVVLTGILQAIGGAPDALRMQRVVSFYEKLPRGAAPEIKARGPLGWYQAKYFGKKPSVQRR